MTDDSAVDTSVAAAEALAKLGVKRPDLAAALANIVKVIADEAVRTPRFAKSLDAALNAAGPPPAAATPPSSKAPARRAPSRGRTPGVIDPFAVYRETGDSGLRDRLDALELEQLRDIIAEHAMDHDKLAMKWRTKSRVIDRIVDKVSTRIAKGSAFRT